MIAKPLASIAARSWFENDGLNTTWGAQRHVGRRWTSPESGWREGLSVGGSHKHVINQRLHAHAYFCMHVFARISHPCLHL